MASVEIKVRGLEQALQRLGAAVGESVLRSAGAAGAQVFKDEVIARAPEATGFLKSQVIIAHAGDKSEGAKRQTYVVRVRGGKYANTRANRRKGRVGQESATGDAYYWRFLEFGTSKAVARPVIRPSWEARRAHALEVMRARLWERVQAALRGSA
nr:HK97-gp10 family putative phage morphogenesis protein [Ramlibacter aurantiacus]